MITTNRHQQSKHQQLKVNGSIASPHHTHTYHQSNFTVTKWNNHFVWYLICNTENIYLLIYLETHYDDEKTKQLAAGGRSQPTSS